MLTVPQLISDINHKNEQGSRSHLYLEFASESSKAKLELVRSLPPDLSLGNLSAPKMSFALAQNATSTVCQQRTPAKPRNVVVAAQRPAAAERKQPSPLARIGTASLGAAAAALLMVRATVCMCSI